jgi:hypothetical protein
MFLLVNVYFYIDHYRKYFLAPPPYIAGLIMLLEKGDFRLSPPHPETAFLSLSIVGREGIRSAAVD